nr:fumarylacetoacetate hydrolase family protein [Streptomyces gobiensis]
MHWRPGGGHQVPSDHATASPSMGSALLPGDVVLTGTPAGVGPITPGDTVIVRISKIGALANTCRGTPQAVAE